MKLFYEHVRIDGETLRFYAQCEICRERKYGIKVPLLCRSVKVLSKSVRGKANVISQSIFNHSKANAVMLLATHFNQCRRCYRWVCDKCFNASDEYGACKECSENSKEDKLWDS